MRKFIWRTRWYLLALACVVVAFSITPNFAWQYFVSVFLYAVAGGLVWAHVSPGCKEPTPLARLREIDKEYR